MCRSRRELSNAYLLAKIGVDTAENEPLEAWGENSIQYSLHALALSWRLHGGGDLLLEENHDGPRAARHPGPLHLLDRLPIHGRQSVANTRRAFVRRAHKRRIRIYSSNIVFSPNRYANFFTSLLLERELQKRLLSFRGALLLLSFRGPLLLLSFRGARPPLARRRRGRRIALVERFDVEPFLLFLSQMSKLRGLVLFCIDAKFCK